VRCFSSVLGEGTGLKRENPKIKLTTWSSIHYTTDITFQVAAKVTMSKSVRRPKLIAIKTMILRTQNYPISFSFNLVCA